VEEIGKKHYIILKKTANLETERNIQNYEVEKLMHKLGPKRLTYIDFYTVTILCHMFGII